MCKESTYPNLNRLYKEKSKLRVDSFCMYFFVFLPNGFSKIVYDEHFICLKYLSNDSFAQSAFLYFFL